MATGEEQGGRAFVTFRLGREEYALPIEKVEGIIRFEPSTPVPRAPEVVTGVINLRGRVIPVIDLSRRLLDARFEPGPTARIIVAEGEAGPVGLSVDAANEVVTLDPETILPPPEHVLAAGITEMIQGVVEIGGRLVILLELDRAVPRAEYVGMAGNTDTEGETDV